MSIGRLMTYGILGLVLFQLFWKSAGVQVPLGSVLDGNLSLDVLRASPFGAKSLRSLPLGTKIKLNQLKGQVSLITFWASWCPACRQELPSMAALAEKYPDLNIVAVNLDENPLGALSEVEKGIALKFLHVLDPQNASGAKLGIRVLPTNLLIDRELKLIWVTGAEDWNSNAARKRIEDAGAGTEKSQF